MDPKNIDEIKYEVIGESKDGKIRQLYWNLAIGLNQVDGLKPSQYFKKLVNENINGKYTYQEVGDLVRKHYSSLEKKYINDGEKECDLVASRIYEIMIHNNFSLQVNTLSRIHFELFKDVLDSAGKYKNQYLAKDEPTLNGLSVVYGDYHDIQEDLEEIINEMKKINFRELNNKEKIKKVAHFTSQLWRVHPFNEGNTRTVSVFIGKYLRKLNYDITNDLFHKNSLYLRNALVRNNFSVPNQDFFGDDDCLIKFFGNLMYNENHLLDIRDTVVKEAFALADGSGYDYHFEDIFDKDVLKDNDEKVKKYLEEHKNDHIHIRNPKVDGLNSTIEDSKKKRDKKYQERKDKLDFEKTDNNIDHDEK